jgi:hypothetical protein
MKENTETLVHASNDVGLELNIEKKNADQNRDIKIANRSFENVSQFRYLRTTLTNINLNQEGIKRRLNSGKPCYYSFQKFLSSRLLSKNMYRITFIYCFRGLRCHKFENP